MYAFVPIWSSVERHARLFAVDPPGFGASERRDEPLSPRAIGRFLNQLIAEVGLGRPHIVAPDVGTSAALLAAAEGPARDRQCGRRHDRRRRAADTREWKRDPDKIQLTPGSVSISLRRLAGPRDEHRARLLGCRQRPVRVPGYLPRARRAEAPDRGALARMLDQLADG